MVHHSHSKSKSSQHNHNHYSVPTSYGPNASFTVNDLGNQGCFNGQSMQRSDSSFSNTDSHDSLLNGNYSARYMLRDNSQSSNSTGNHSAYSPLDAINHNGLYEPNIDCLPSPVDSYPLQSVSSAGFPMYSYATDWSIPRTEVAAVYQQTMDSPIPQISPGMQQNGDQESQPAKYTCLMPDCTWSFARQADLKRHYNHSHSPKESLDHFYCDYKQCLRSQSGSRLALERMGGRLHEKVAGIGPFTRKDHFKAHLRQQHQEALPKRDPKNDPGWSDGKILKDEWWRCLKCLKRVWIQKQRDGHNDEYTCCNCGTPCDQEVINARQMVFP